METCATHGLRYDPNLHSGCTLCRRLEAVPTALAALQAEEQRPRWNNRVYAVVGVLGLGALLYWVWHGAVSGGANMGHGWGGVCARRCAANTESYSQQCGTSDSTSPCYTTAAGMLNDCLRGCTGPKLGEGELSLVYSTGDAPEWSQLVGPLTSAMKDVGSCRKGTFAARLSVMPNGKITRVGAGSPDGAAAECIEIQFLQSDVTLPKGEYMLAVRGQAAPPLERLPHTPEPKAAAGAEKPKAIDYLAQANKLAAEEASGKRKPAVSAAPGEVTLVPLPPAIWKPRDVSMEGLVSEVQSGRGHPVAMILYDVDCDSCDVLLDGLRDVVAQLRTLVEFRFYAVMSFEGQRRFGEYASKYEGMFEPERLLVLDQEYEQFPTKLRKLGIYDYKGVPAFALFNARGSIVLQGADEQHMSQLNAALQRLAYEPNMAALPSLPPPPPDRDDDTRRYYAKRQRQIGQVEHYEPVHAAHYPEPPELPGREPAAEPEPEPPPDDGEAQPEQ